MIHLCNDVQFGFLCIKLQQFCTSSGICEIQRNKIKSLNLNKNRLFNINCNIKNFIIMLRFFEKKRISVDVKAKFFFGIGLQTFLQIRRFRRSVCRVHGCSAPPPFVFIISKVFDVFYVCGSPIVIIITHKQATTIPCSNLIL